MSANLSGKDIDNGDFMIKTCTADPEAGYAKEKFRADPKNGIIISEVDGEKGKCLEFSADWSVVSLDTKLQEGDNIEISEDQRTGKVEISAPNVGQVKTVAGDTLKYLLDALANVSDDEIIIAQGSEEHVGQVVLEIPNVGKVKIDDQDETFGYLDEKISVPFPLIKAYGGSQHNRIYIRCAEKIAFAQNDISGTDWAECRFGWHTAACTVAQILTDQTTVSGVNFVVKQANPSTICIQYHNLSGSAQTLKLYAIPFPTGSWSQALTFDVDLYATPPDSVYTAEVEVRGLGDYPIAFLLASSEVADNIFIYNIYKY